MNISMNAVVAAFAMLVATGAAAVPVLDQDNSSATVIGAGAGSLGTTFGRAQTFTVGVAGDLAAIEFQLGNVNDTPSRIDILATSGGVPTGGSPVDPSVLGTVFGGTNNAGWASFDVLSLGLSVAVGDVLAFKVWEGHVLAADTSYAGGNAFFFNTGANIDDWATQSSELLFRTYVEEAAPAVPLPAGLPLLLSGVAALAITRKRRTST